MCVCLHVCMYVHYTSAGTFGGQKKVLEPLDLVLQVVMNHHEGSE